MAEENEGVADQVICPCGQIFATFGRYMCHVRARHSAAPVLSVYNKPGRFIMRCVGCNLAYLVDGIRRHRRGKPLCMAAYMLTVDAQVEAQQGEQEGGLAGGQAAEQAVDAHDPDYLTHTVEYTIDEFKALIRAISKPLIILHHSWKVSMARLLDILLRAMDTDVQQRHLRAYVALLVFPAVVRQHELLKKRPILFLRAALASSNVVNFIINKATEVRQLVRAPAINFPTERSVDRTVNRINKLWKQQRPGQATQTLNEFELIRTGAAMPDNMTQAHIEQELLRLNPVANEEDEYTAEDMQRVHDSIPHQVSGQSVKDSLRRAPKGSSGGWTSLTFLSMVTALNKSADLDVTCDLIARWFNRILRGKGCKELWTVCRAAFIPKGNGMNRPLGIADVWTRLLGRTIVKDLGVSIGNKLRPHQFGLGISGGCEIAGRSAQLALNARPDAVLVNTDISNAFNEMRRRKILLGVLSYASVLATFFVFSHSGAADLVVNGVVSGYNWTGVIQGENLGCVYFPAGLQATLIDINVLLVELYPDDSNGRVQAFLDDNTISCLAEHAAQVADAVVRIYEAHHLRLNMNKSVIIHNPGIVIPGVLPFPQTEGHVCLGVPIGRQDFREQFITTKLNKMAASLVDLHRIGPIAALGMLKLCINARPGYLSRVCEFREMRPLLLLFDTKIDEAVATVAKTSLVSNPMVRTIRSLSLQQAGLGMNRYGGCYGEKACLLSRELTRTYIDAFPPGSAVAAAGMTHWPQLSIGNSLQGQDDDADYPPLDIIPTKTALTQRTDAIQSQSALNLTTLLQHEQRHGSAAHFISNQFNGSGQWLTRSSSGGCILSDSSFCESLRLRLLLPLFEDVCLGTIVQCSCGVLFDMLTSPYHFICCARQAHWFWNKRHDEIAVAVGDFHKTLDPTCQLAYHPAAGIHPHGEQRRGDLRVTKAASTKVIDVVVSCPSTVQALQAGSSTGADVANCMAEVSKLNSYANVGELIANGSFIPYAVETSGRTGPLASAYVSELAVDHRDALHHLTFKVGLILAKYNGSMMSILRAKATQSPHHVPAGFPQYNILDDNPDAEHPPNWPQGFAVKTKGV
jgi:hypothetical protein